MFYCDEHLKKKKEKETTYEPKDKLNECVCSAEGVSAAKTFNTLKSISGLCALVSGRSTKEPLLRSNVLKSRQFYFSIENEMYSGCLVQE